MTASYLNSGAVLVIEPASDTMRLLRPSATLALVERYMGEDFVLTTDDQCEGDGKNGIEAAARVYAEATGAAYCSREGS